MFIKHKVFSQPKLVDVLQRRSQTVEEFMTQLGLDERGLKKYCDDNNIECPVLIEKSKPVVQKIEKIVEPVADVVQLPKVVVQPKKPKALPVIQDAAKKTDGVPTEETPSSK